MGTFTLKAKPDAPKVGYADNLILEIFSDVGANGQRASLGILPAVSFQIVKPFQTMTVLDNTKVAAFCRTTCHEEAEE